MPRRADLALEAEKPVKKGDSLIILLPGLMGSTLEDTGNDPQLMWINPLAYIRGEVNRSGYGSRWAVRCSPRRQDRGKRPAVDRLCAPPAGLAGQLRSLTASPYDWRRFTWDTVPKLQAFIDQKLAESRFEHVTLSGTAWVVCSASTTSPGENSRPRRTTRQAPDHARHALPWSAAGGQGAGAR
jgi:hypothetical protein